MRRTAEVNSRENETEERRKRKKIKDDLKMNDISYNADDVETREA